MRKEPWFGHVVMYDKHSYFAAVGYIKYAISDIEVVNLLSMQQGIGWPHTLIVAEGNEALLKLTMRLDNQQTCEVTTPAGERFNVANPPNNRYQQWSDGCGIRVRNIVASDEGRWRLTASRQGYSITGWSEVYVEEPLSSYPATPISLLDGEEHREVELTSIDNSYCLVAQPFSESSLVSGHCRVTLDRATRAVQGHWNVLLGIPGQVSELHIDRRVDVEAERLDVGYVHDSAANKLHLYCNILHTVKNITFCRFQKTGDTVGFNVKDGLSDGSHSYYGDGFHAKHCGMTVENPTHNDYTTWRCSVGVKQWINTHIENQTPLQALVNVPQQSGHMTIKNNTRADGSTERIIFVEENVTFSINCQANVSLTYCWFQHPNGSQFTPLQFVNEEQQFWYTGESLEVGNCGITFVHVKQEDAGQWTCHMGPRSHSGIEITDQVTVRVTGPLAANTKEISARVGGSVTLYCHTSNGNRPLNYCRFLSPSNLGITIDETVAQENAILGRYYFTPERNPDYGDCSLTIDPVHKEDFGEWTCAAVISQLVAEARDNIQLNIDNSSSLSRAGIIGMVIGISVLVVILIVYVGYKRNWNVPFWRGNNSTSRNPQVQDNRSSVSSSGSSTQDTIGYNVGSGTLQIT
ncbi:uncharacterized protein ACR2FA_007370 [Aphomia sociella]